MPESPRWLVFHKKGEKARRVLLRSRTTSKVDEEMEAIEKDYVVQKQNKMGEGNWSHVGHMQVTCKSHAGHMQVACNVYIYIQFFFCNVHFSQYTYIAEIH